MSVKKFIFGASLVGMSMGAASCSKDKEPKDAEKPQTEVEIDQTQCDPYGNVALFESCRSKIKFALSFVENHYDFVYWCGEAWTTGDGLTILYNADGTYNKVTQDTKVPTLAESDIYKGRYLTFEILSDIKNCVTVPMDENTLIAASVLRYCIGHQNFKKSSFVNELNSGKKGAELAKTLTGWRQQHGVPNRCYFFASLMAGKIQYSDLLDLRAEGCYNLTWEHMFVYGEKGPKCDNDGFYEWDYSKVQENLKKAKKPRCVTLHLDKKKNGKTVSVDCKLVKDIVPDYVWQEVSEHERVDTSEYDGTDANKWNDLSYYAYGNGDYEIALKHAKKALKYAKDDKQRCAAYFNKGEAYMGMHKYGHAKDCYEKSLANKKTDIAQKQLNLAQEKLAARNQTRRQNAGNFGLGFGAGLIAGVAIAHGRKRLLIQHQKKMSR